MTAALATRKLSAGYGSVPVIRDVDICVDAGEVVALLGPNGAGKTTLLNTLSGALEPSSGSVVFHGVETRSPVHRRARAGLRFLAAEHSVIRSLSVSDNLRLGRASMATYLALFPELEPLVKRSAGVLSGGEQQMLALALSLGDDPKVLLADELSLGLAPLVVSRLLIALRQAADRGTAVLLVEQQINAALAVCDRGYVLQRGEVAMQGSAAELRTRAHEIEGTYLSEAALGPATRASSPIRLSRTSGTDS